MANNVNMPDDTTVVKGLVNGIYSYLKHIKNYLNKLIHEKPHHIIIGGMLAILPSSMIYLTIIILNTYLEWVMEALLFLIIFLITTNVIIERLKK